jgi:hypothetical protein
MPTHPSLLSQLHCIRYIIMADQDFLHGREAPVPQCDTGLRLFPMGLQANHVRPCSSTSVLDRQAGTPGCQRGQPSYPDTGSHCRIDLSPGLLLLAALLYGCRQLVLGAPVL